MKPPLLTLGSVHYVYVPGLKITVINLVHFLFVNVFIIDHES